MSINLKGVSCLLLMILRLNNYQPAQQQPFPIGFPLVPDLFDEYYLESGPIRRRVPGWEDIVEAWPVTIAKDVGPVN